jgi:transcriptional regulator NrdR family protein
MVCPYCQARNNHRVVSSRTTRVYISRRRLCLACQKRFTTHEEIAPRTQYKLLKEGRASGHAGFRLLAENHAVLSENQYTMIHQLNDLLRHFGLKIRVPIPDAKLKP